MMMMIGYHKIIDIALDALWSIYYCHSEVGDSLIDVSVLHSTIRINYFSSCSRWEKNSTKTSLLRAPASSFPWSTRFYSPKAIIPVAGMTSMCANLHEPSTLGLHDEWKWKQVNRIACTLFIACLFYWVKMASGYIFQKQFRINEEAP